MNPLQLTPLADGGVSSQAPYFNDYTSAIEKNYYAILFKSAYPVQNRELTQLQYLLQNQVNSLGSYVFKNGSLVLGSSDHQMCDVVVIDQTGTDTLVATELVGRQIKNVNSDAQGVFHIADAKILPVLNTNTNAVVVRLCLFVTNSSPLVNGSTLIPNNATFSIAATEQLVEVTATVSDFSITQKALVAHVDESVFFYDGYFLRTAAQSSVVFTINSITGIANFDISNTTAKAGLFVEKDIATIGTDETLGDPAAGSTNFGGAGADRLKINLGLGILPWDGLISDKPDDNFIELFRFKNGVIVGNTEKPQNGPILDLLATQVAEINGSFTVQPFKISFNSENAETWVDESDMPKPQSFGVTLEKGVAYNNGYRVETQENKIFTGETAIQKARTTQSVSTAEIPVAGARYVLVKLHPSYGNDLPNPSIAPIVDLFNGATKIGKARFTGLVFAGIDAETSEKFYNCYLSNITMLDYAPFTSVTAIKKYNSTTMFLPYETPLALRGDGDFVAIAPITTFPVDELNISDARYVAQRSAIAQAFDSSQSYTFTDTTGSGIVGVGATALDANAIASNFIFFETVAGVTTDITSLVTDFTGIIGTNLRYTSVSFKLNRTYNATGKTITVYFKINVQQPDIASSLRPTFRLKYLKLNCLIGTADSDRFNLPDNGVVNLRIPDVYRIRKIIATEINGGLDVTSLFALDNGQADTIYDYAKIRVISTNLAGLNTDSESLSGKFGGKLKVYADVFQWSGDKGMFSPASYIWETGISSDRSVRKEFSLLKQNQNIPKRDVENQPWFGNYSQENVLSYKSSISGKTFLLDRCFDFRQRVPTSITFNMTAENVLGTTGYEHSYRITPNTAYVSDIMNASLDEAYIPCSIAGNNIIASYKFYLPRVDSAVLSSDNKISIIQGIPSTTPVPPAIPVKSLALWDINVPAYTPEPVASYITAEYINNQRLTSREIHALSTRLDRVEKSIALDQLEAKLINERIMDPTAPQTEMMKMGIFSDKFVDFSLADNYNTAYYATIDATSQTLRPGVTVQNLTLQPSAFGSIPAFPEQTIANRVYRQLSQAGSSIALFDNRFVTLTPDDEESVFVYQTLASSTINLNPFAVFAWQGQVSVKPAIDNWVDTNATVTTVNSTGLTIFGQNWQDWSDTLVGPVRVNGQVNGVDPTTGITWNNVHATTSLSVSGRHAVLSPDGIWRQRIAVGRGLSGSGTRINTNIIAYLRPRPLFLSVSGLKPNTQMYVFFDKTDVTNSCVKRENASRWADTSADILSTTPVTGVSAVGAKTDAAGNFDVIFNIPANTFVTGTRNITVTSNASGLTGIGDSFATGTFQAQGISTTQETFVIDPTIVEEVTWRDPIAQSFLVSSAQHPNGIALSSIDLFFRTKDDTIPVIIEIRPSVNGYPNNSVTIASSRIVVSPDDIVIGTNPDGTQIPTTMRFAAPVFLPPGEYHIVARSNSNSYTVWTAITGDVDSTGKRITTQPYAGTFFKSANNSTWIPDGSRTLSFVLRRYTWNDQINVQASSIKFENVASEINPLYIDTMFVKAEVIDFGSAEYTIDWSYAGVDAASGSPDVRTIFTPNENTSLTSRKQINTNNTMSVFAALKTYNPDLSPTIDISQLSLTAIKNVIELAVVGSETEPTPTINNFNQFRYITKPITLANGFEAFSLRVDMQLMLPPYYSFEVYVKALGSHDASSTFEQRPWEKLKPASTLYPVYDNKSFNEVSFVPEDPMTGITYEESGLIKTFAIKIVANKTSANANLANPPLVKNLRGVALL